MRCIEAGTGDVCMICGRVYKGGEIVFQNYGSVYCAEFCGWAGGKISIPKDVSEAGKFEPKRRVPNIEQRRAFNQMTRKAQAQKSLRRTRREIVDHVDEMDFGGVSGISESHKVSEPDGWVDPMQKVKDDLGKMGGK